MTEAMQRVKDKFDMVNIKYNVVADDKEMCAIRILLRNGDAPAQITVIGRQDDKDFECALNFNFVIARMAEEKRDVAIKLANQFNCKYNCVKFLIDDEQDFQIRYNFLNATPLEKIGDMAFEIIVRMTNILGEVTPEIMKLKWA